MDFLLPGQRRGGYSHEPLKNITYATAAFYFAFILFAVIANRRRLARRVFWVFVAYPVITAYFVVFQFFRPHMLLTGIASFSAVYFAYLMFQVNLAEIDIATGLMTEPRLKKRVAAQKGSGVLYVLSIENMNLLRSGMDHGTLARFFLSMGGLLKGHFPHDSYRISTHRFAAVGGSMAEVREKAAAIEAEAGRLASGTDSYCRIPLDCRSVAVPFSRGKNDYDTLMDVVNGMIARTEHGQPHALLVCDEAVLADRERKRHIYRILQRELRPDSEQFQVWYQPIYSRADRQFTYMEALARLRGTELGDISPQEFVQVAESRGLIERLGDVAFEKVCRFISDNRDSVRAVSVNFSVYQMTNPDLVRNVLSTLERFSLRPENIVMEITESMFIDNYDLVRAHMVLLAAAGVKFYLDDFGTGYSNLSNVFALPFSTVKMDRSLVLMMEESARGENLFTNLVSTFKGASLSVLVEGVETDGQNALVERVGVDYIQGFLYSRPLAPADCVALLRNGRRDSAGA